MIIETEENWDKKTGFFQYRAFMAFSPAVCVLPSFASF
jgi:hypothetical protein